MSPLRHARLPDFLIIGQERWDEIERRNQLLVRALAARNPSSRFLFAERALRPKQVFHWRWPSPLQVAPNIWKLQLIRPVSDRVSPRTSDRVEARQALRGARLVGLESPFVWTQDPHAADLLDTLCAAGLVYDLTDDWAAFESDPKRRALVQARIDKLAHEADVIFACSRSLSEAARRAGAAAIYLPNAIDGLKDPVPVPDALAGLPGPKLGYAGTLHASRLDIDLLTGAAAMRPDWSFVLLGPDLLMKEDRERLFSRPNVHYLGVRPHGEVAGYIGGLDVGLVPNRVTDFTASLDPLKTYQYLAEGVPVIATATGISPDLERHVDVVGSPRELVSRAAQLISENSAAQADARRALVSRQTWSVRAASVESALGVVEQSRELAGVSVVVVNFNTRELLRKCLASIRDQGRRDVQAVVVDNGSTDGSQKLVHDEFPEFELVQLPENVGFGRANNAAFARCCREFVLLLNSDAFLHAGAIDALVAAARRHPQSAVVGPRLLNQDGTLQRSAWPFPHPARLLAEALGLHRVLRRCPFYEDLGTWDHAEERAVDFLVGACLLVRSRALEEVKGFDEAFYMYAEETDLQRRLRRRGWSVVLAPSARVTHVGGASAVDTATRLSQFYAGQMRYLRKHRSAGAVAAGRLALLVGSILRGRWTAARISLLTSPHVDDDAQGYPPRVSSADQRR